VREKSEQTKSCIQWDSENTDTRVVIQIQSGKRTENVSIQLRKSIHSKSWFSHNLSFQLFQLTLCLVISQPSTTVMELDVSKLLNYSQTTAAKWSAALLFTRTHAAVRHAVVVRLWSSRMTVSAVERVDGRCAAASSQFVSTTLAETWGHAMIMGSRRSSRMNAGEHVELKCQSHSRSISGRACAAHRFVINCLCH